MGELNPDRQERKTRVPAASEEGKCFSPETELTLVHALCRSKYGKDWMHKIGISKIRGGSDEQLEDIYSLDPSLRDDVAIIKSRRK